MASMQTAAAGTITSTGWGELEEFDPSFEED
eukprot:SAG22_NODE_5664_length_975_cov_1.101598_2_plen_30_part_01